VREVLTVMHGGRNHESVKRKPLPLIFDNKDINVSIVPNHNYSLSVKTFINNKEVHRLLVDIGSFMDIVFNDFLRNLKNPIVGVAPL